MAILLVVWMDVVEREIHILLWRMCRSRLQIKLSTEIPNGCECVWNEE